jgi:hypothetical protein
MSISETHNEVLELKLKTYPCGALSCKKKIILKDEIITQSLAVCLYNQVVS